MFVDTVFALVKKTCIRLNMALVRLVTVKIVSSNHRFNIVA